MSYDQRSPTRTGPGSGVWAAQDQEKKSKRLVATMKRPRIEPICFPNSSQRTCGRRATGLFRLLIWVSKRIWERKIAERRVPKFQPGKGCRLHVIRRYGF